MVARSAGCSYEDIVANLEDRYGQPATVAAACIEKLTVGPKLGNRDFNGLRNFAELQCATKRLEGDYEREASTTANMKLIAGRLPDYLINKWANLSYSIREKGLIPALKDILPSLSNDRQQLRMTQDLQVLLRYLPRRKEEAERNHRMEQMTLQTQGGLHPL